MKILIISAIYFTVLFFHIKYLRKRENKQIDNLKKINEELQKKCTLRFKEYHNFFRIMSYIKNHYNPFTISTYFYKINEKIDKTVIKYGYQITDTDIKPIFTGDYDNISISNSNFLTRAYYEKSTIYLEDIKKLDKYDNDLYYDLVSKKINKLYLINIFPDKKSPNHILPFAFIVLSFNTDGLNREQMVDINKQCKELSSVLKNILH